MALQPSITEYFSSRKRPAIDEAKRNSQPSKKVMILENAEGDVSVRKLVDDKRNLQTIPAARRKLIYPNRESNNVGSAVEVKCSNLSKKKILRRVLVGERKICNSLQPDIRKTFGVVNGKASSISTSSSKAKETSENSTNETLTGSSRKDMKIISGEKAESLVENVEKSELSSTQTIERTQIQNASSSREELNLGKLKNKIQQSSRLNELKASLAKLNDGFAKLDKIQKKEKNIRGKVELDKFDMITFESSIPSPSKKTPVKMGMSPAKLREAAFRSPGRRLDMDDTFVSPRKLLESMPSTPPPASPLKSPLKSPAFQRYQALVSEGKSALTLPFKYRSLAEVFRAIETIVSMLEKREETTTFTKLKNSVQEILRRNLCEKHLAQIKSVNENLYNFQYEKVHVMGSKMLPDKYELVIKPVLSTTKVTDDSTKPANIEMTPDVLLERRRHFYNCLLEKTKLFHEKFLSTLDPPLVVPRESLTRWHPEFDVDGVPDIELAALPEPPCTTKVSTAKDVLERARNLFTSNPRMERALQKVSEQSSTPDSAATPVGNTGPAVAALTSALRGIPKSLLEKVRAKQAAKAMEAMTRSPSQAKEAIRLTRLPEIARIVRNTFISEKKSVLTRELILKKLSNSYRESLSFQELDSHLNLLQEKSPEWLNFCTLRKTDYVRFVKDADMIRVMAKLEALATEHSY